MEKQVLNTFSFKYKILRNKMCLDLQKIKKFRDKRDFMRMGFKINTF